MISSQEQEARREEAKAVARDTGRDPAVLAAAGSVALSWYFFFVAGDKERGLFVGLWAPTIIAFANYFRQTRLSETLAADRERSVRNTVERLIGNE